jgi:hypothetical protein
MTKTLGDLILEQTAQGRGDRHRWKKRNPQ